MINDEIVRTSLQEVLMSCPDKYARVYANMAIEDEMTGRKLKHQVLYVLSNVSTWRGEVARQTKAILREYVKR